MENKKDQKINDVLRLCMSNTTGKEENDEVDEVKHDSGPESREWLKEVLSQMSENTVIKRLTLNIKDCLDSFDNPNLQSILLDDMMDLCEDLDMAKDFNTIGGYNILMPLLNCDDARVKSRCAHLIAILVQNNPHCQQAALDTADLMIRLTELLADNQTATASATEGNGEQHLVGEKALLAISCIVRNFEPGLDTFIDKYDGLQLLINTIQSPNKTLQMKSSFLLSQIVSHINNVSRANLDDLTKQLIYVLEVMSSYPRRDEFICYALLELVKKHGHSLDLLVQHGFEWIKERINNELKDREECEEETSYSLEIYKLCLRNKKIDR